MDSMISFLTTLTLPFSAEAVVPHRPPMLLVDELLERSGDHVRGRTRLRQENLFLNAEGVMSRPGLVEIMAQTVAAGNGYSAIMAGETIRVGFLVGVSDFQFYDEARGGDTLSISALQTSKIGNFSMVEGEIRSADRLIARGGLKFFEFEGAQQGEPPLTETSFPPLQEKKGSWSFHSPPSPIARAISEAMSEAAPSDKGMTAIFSPPLSFTGFNGHFPGFPILPGVVMLEAALLLAEALAEASLRLSRVEKAKFSRQVSPGESLTLEVSMRDSVEGSIVQAKLAVGREPAGVFTLLAAPERKGETP